MRFAPIIFVSLTLLGCSQESQSFLPTAPGPPVPTASAVPAPPEISGIRRGRLLHRRRAVQETR